MPLTAGRDEHALSQARDETFAAVQDANVLLDESNERQNTSAFVKETMDDANNFNPVDSTADTW